MMESIYPIVRDLETETYEVNFLNQRLADIAGEHYEQSTVNKKDLQTGKIHQIYSIVEVDKSKSQNKITIYDDRLVNAAINRNHVNLIKHENSWVAIYAGDEQEYYCKTEHMIYSVYGCLIKAYDGGETLQELAPVQRSVKSITHGLTAEDTILLETIKNAKPEESVETIFRRAIEPESKVEA